MKAHFFLAFALTLCPGVALSIDRDLMDIANAAREGARSLGIDAFHPDILEDYRRPFFEPDDIYADKETEPPTPKTPYAKGVEGLTEENLQPLYDIPIVLNEHVLRYIVFFSEGPGRKHFARYLDRSFRWIPMMHEILDSYNLPRDLVYVAMIESGFSMRAYSHAHAVGPWQFIGSTAEIYDLRMDAWVDERRDPVKATHAAARFMTWLHKEFDDWFLAWAGYNGGPTRVRRNMRATGLEDYWDLCEVNRLPRETCGYVPKIMAAAIISRFPERFGFEPEPHPPFEYDSVKVKQPTDLSTIATLLGVSLDELRGLNPELRRTITPPVPRNHKGYPLRLPPNTGELFLARQDELKPSQYVSNESYTVRPGDSFWRIARAHNTTVQAIVSANPGVDPQRLMPGVELLVPLPPGSRPRVPAASEAPSSSPKGQNVAVEAGRVEVHHRVEPGDTLWRIAQRHAVTTHQLISWNNLAASGEHVHLSVGQTLIVGYGRSNGRVVEEGRPVHVLQAGETLWQLSQRYGISVDDLLSLNNIRDVHSLRVGQVIVVGRQP